MKLKIIILLVFAFFLFGCTVENNSSLIGDNSSLIGDNSSLNDENSLSNEENLIEPNPPILDESIFCKMPQEHKFYYEENYYAGDMVPGVTMQRYQKQTTSSYMYFEKLMDAPDGVGTWGIATKDEFIVYSNSDGECFAMKHTQNNNPFLMEEPIYYSNEFTGETKKIGESELGWKLKQNENLGEKVGTEIVTLADYISEEYCVPLVQEVNSLDFASYSEKVNFTRTFSDNVFEIPKECETAPIIDLN
jgi:hypothetical protein